MVLGLVAFAVTAAALRRPDSNAVGRPVMIEVKHEIIETTLRAPAVILRREEVVAAPAGGRLNRLIAHGERVRAGFPVAVLSAAHVLTAPVPGVISYQIDGLEARLVPEIRHELSPSAVKNINDSLVSDPEGQEIRGGQPVFKIIDTGALYLAVVLGPEDNLEASSGSVWKIRLPSGAEGQAVAERMGNRDSQGSALIIFRVRDLFGELALRRRLDVAIVAGRVDGPVLPASSLVYKKGRSGVFFVIGNRAVWKPVEFEAAADGKVLVRGLNPGAVVVTDPSAVKSGQIIPN